MTGVRRVTRKGGRVAGMAGMGVGPGGLPHPTFMTSPGMVHALMIHLLVHHTLMRVMLLIRSGPHRAWTYGDNLHHACMHVVEEMTVKSPVPDSVSRNIH